MIRIKLREAIDSYGRRTGSHLTYDELAQATGLSLQTIQSCASRPGYNATLATIDRLCAALRCDVATLLERVSEGGDE